jgi:hypothetical protein
MIMTRYATGSNFSFITSASLEISQSLNNGNRWYVTLYTQSNYPLQTFIEATETDPLFHLIVVQTMIIEENLV